MIRDNDSQYAANESHSAPFLCVASLQSDDVHAISGPRYISPPIHLLIVAITGGERTKNFRRFAGKRLPTGFPTINELSYRKIR